MILVICSEETESEFKALNETKGDQYSEYVSMLAYPGLYIDSMLIEKTPEILTYS